MKYALIISAWLIQMVVLSQTNPDIKRTWHWYFGYKAGLDFSTGVPVADTTGKLHSDESCAVMSDTAGNLLFYTDGDTVWDRRHIMMPNGYGLMSCINYGGSSARGVLIVPHPGNDSLYYIFTVDCSEHTVIDGVRYSLLNMNKNGGYGDIVLKNILLFKPVTESIVGTQTNSKDTVWIVTHEFNNNVFRVYRIDKNGLDTVPVKNAVGGAHTDYITYMSFSNDGKKLVAYNYAQIGPELFDFDLSKGKLTKRYSLPSGDYGACFSPDNSKLYFTSNGNILIQYDLCTDNEPAISFSDTVLDNSTYGAISSTPDTSILLIGPFYNDSASYITNPNSLINTVNIHKFSISLIGRISMLGLPNFIQSYFYTKENTCNTSNTSGQENKPDIEYAVIPNIFTPNNDNVNDYFSVQLSGYKYIEYYIYNRWGELVHSDKRNITSNGQKEEPLWDGKINREYADTGIYYYVIKLITAKDEEEIKRGYITLLK